MPTAAAAQEAGYRPCLRCRPESSPELDAWRGTEATVSRALKLIESGALDEGDVASLADRLDIGERQLRRLFSQHIGAAPITVAQTRRVLLAKQLIHQTDLSMIEVALASGFGSVRRFNEVFQRMYQRRPSELRRRTAATSDPAEITILLPYRPPYDWATMIRFLEVRAIPGLEVVDRRNIQSRHRVRRVDWFDLRVERARTIVVASDRADFQSRCSSDDYFSASPPIRFGRRDECHCVCLACDPILRRSLRRGLDCVCLAVGTDSKSQSGRSLVNRSRSWARRRCLAESWKNWESKSATGA